MNIYIFIYICIYMYVYMYIYTCSRPLIASKPGASPPDGSGLVNITT